MRSRIQTLTLSLVLWSITFGVGYALGCYGGRSEEKPSGAVSKIAGVEVHSETGTNGNELPDGLSDKGPEGEMILVSTMAWITLNPLIAVFDTISEDPPKLDADIIATLQLEPAAVSQIDEVIVKTWNALRAREADAATTKQLTPDKTEVMIPSLGEKGGALQTEFENEVKRILGEKRSEDFLLWGGPGIKRVFKDFGMKKCLIWFERSVVDGKPGWEITTFTTSEDGASTNQESFSELDPRLNHLPGFPKN